MKFVRIGRTPFIANETDRWGRELPTFMVYHENAGYVTEGFWKELQEFENHSIEQELLETVFSTGQTMSGNIQELSEMLPITKRLLARAHGQLWEFNMYQKPGSEELIRTYAMLGEPTLKNWTFVDDIRLAYLRWKCNNMNKRVLNEDNAAQR